MAIANEVVKVQPCEQLNEEPVKEEIDDDDSSRDSDKTDTQGILSHTTTFVYNRFRVINHFLKTCVT